MKFIIDFVLELAPGGELFQYLNKYGKMSLSTTIFYSAEIIMACEYMHQVGVLHRDLKPENILLSREMHVKITDFGTATLIEESKGLFQIYINFSEAFVGTVQYLAPEVIEGKAHTEK